MKTTKRMLLLAPACLLAAMSFVTPALAHGSDTAAMKKTMAGGPGSMELHRVMAKGHDMRMSMSGNVDKDFAMMMSMHHQQAIDMINVYSKHGKNAELKAMAMKMKSAQTEEIKQLSPFAGPMDHSKMMDHGKMDHGSMKVDHAKMATTEFAALDNNKDGKVSRSEVPASNALNQHFGMLDGNKDGSLSQAEFAKHHGM